MYLPAASLQIEICIGEMVCSLPLRMVYKMFASFCMAFGRNYALNYLSRTTMKAFGASHRIFVMNDTEAERSR